MELKKGDVFTMAVLMDLVLASGMIALCVKVGSRALVTIIKSCKKIGEAWKE